MTGAAGRGARPRRIAASCGRARGRRHRVRPGAIADRSTYPDPHQYAVGVSTVVVNGEVVVDGGDHTGALPGRVIMRGA